MLLCTFPSQISCAEFLCVIVLPWMVSCVVTTVRSLLLTVLALQKLPVKPAMGHHLSSLYTETERGSGEYSLMMVLSQGGGHLAAAAPGPAPHSG